MTLTGYSSRAVCLFLAVAASGCSAIGYYAQSISGQLDLLSRRQPIEQLLADGRLDPERQERLKRILEMRRFATEVLALPDNRSYLSYADLEREFVVWNVFATPELSLEPLTWCFPLVGCLSYRGYFAERNARNFAARLVEQGHDVYIGGVAAYSTLGWFDDPVLNTMMKWGEPRLAEVLFHELAHQRLYIADDTDFNEAFATVVARRGVELWLQANGSDQALDSFGRQKARDDAVVALILEFRRTLDAVYQSDLSDAEKRSRKAQILGQLQATYKELRAQWDGYKGYDRWMETDLNNAKLASVATYHRFVGGFQALLALADGDFSEYYSKVEGLGVMAASERHQCLADLAATEPGRTPPCID